MKIVNSVLAFQNYQKLSDVIAEGPKQASEKRESIKSEQVNKTKWFCLGYGVMVIMPNEKNE